MASNSIFLPERALAIYAHPDVIEFSCAGTLARWAEDGCAICYVLVTSGDVGIAKKGMTRQEAREIREKEQLDAARLLGVREVIFLRHPDQGLEDTPKFRKEIERLIRTYKPETVVTADPYRRYIWHRDHRITGQVTLDAIFPYARDFHSYPDLLDEGLNPHKVKEVWLWAAQEPNYRTDITTTFATKIAALRCHKSQVGDYPVNGLEERLKERHRELARGEDFELAEAFYRAEIIW